MTKMDERLEADLPGRAEAQPRRGRVPPGRARGARVGRAGPREVPRVPRAQDHRADRRAGAADHLPRALAGRQRRGADQPRLPRPVQQRARPVQGRAALPPLGLPRHHQVPRLRADLQERPHRPAHRRRQGRLRLRPQGQVGRRGHALLPELHDRAVALHRRAHRRPRRRHRRGRPRDRLHVRPVQAAHLQATRRASSPARGSTTAARSCAPRPPATAPPSSSRRCSRSARTRSTARRCVVSGSGNVAIYTIEKIDQLGGKVVACSDSNGYILDEKGIDLELVKQLKERRARAASRTTSSTASTRKYVAGRQHLGDPLPGGHALGDPERDQRQGRRARS